MRTFWTEVAGGAFVVSVGPRSIRSPSRRFVVGPSIYRYGRRHDARTLSIPLGNGKCDWLVFDRIDNDGDTRK